MRAMTCVLSWLLLLLWRWCRPVQLLSDESGCTRDEFEVFVNVWASLPLAKADKDFPSQVVAIGTKQAMLDQKFEVPSSRAHIRTRHTFQTHALRRTCAGRIMERGGITCEYEDEGSV